jgi:serine/threonine protein kinase
MQWTCTDFRSTRVHASRMKKPTLFGKYLLLERLNVGGMAEVFTAKAFGVEGFERILAIKKILPTMAEDDEFITMFIDEARISVQLNHANVVHIHELGKHDEAYYIAMEYVSGKDLRALLERFRRRREIMPTAMAVFVASKMCEGLDYAHRKRDARGQELFIIHRDVSPQNILISYEGDVKIIDFGIAKAANRSQKTQAGILKGKFGYMSPEQVRGQPIDRRSDIFAVGVTLYEMLTGEKLFVGESDFSTLEKVRNAEVPLPRQFNPSIPAGLEKVVLKSLAREVEDRYQWASDLQEDLMRFLLAGDSIYSGKHLSSFMKEAFAEDLYREAEKMERYSAVSLPDDLDSPVVKTASLKRAAVVTPPPAQPAPPRARNASPAMSHSSGAGAVAVGLQNANLVIPPPTAQELAEMDGSADRTIIMPSSAAPKPASKAGAPEIDLKTAIGLQSPYGEKPPPAPLASARVQVRSDEPAGSAPGASAATHEHLPPFAGPVSGAGEGRLGDRKSPPGRPQRDDDLKPIEMTGFRPAIETGDDLAEEVASHEVVNGLTSPMPRPNRPKVVIGDAPINGATTVGPSPLAGNVNDTLAPSSSRSVGAFGLDAARANTDAQEEDDDRSEAREASPAEADFEEEAPPEDEATDALEARDRTDERPALKPERPRPAPLPRRSEQERVAARGKPAKKRPLVMVAIGVLALLAVVVVGAAVVKLLTPSRGKLGIVVKPDVQFTVTINKRRFDGAKALDLEPGKYTVLVEPRAPGFANAQLDIEIVGGRVTQREVKLKKLPEPATEPADGPESAESAPAAPPSQPASPQAEGPRPGSPAPEVAPNKTPEKAPAKPQSWAALVSADEPGIEIVVDGKVRGTTPQVRLSDLVGGKPYRAIARKPGFLSKNLIIENPAAEATVTVSLKLEPEPVKQAPPQPKPPEALPAVVKRPPGPVVREPPPQDRGAPPAKASATKGRLMKVKSNPVGADVYVDGKPTGRKTPIIPAVPLELSTGKHRLTFKFEGKMSPPVEVIVSEGDNTTLINVDIPR